jgi:hypothetical protein
MKKTLLSLVPLTLWLCACSKEPPAGGGPTGTAPTGGAAPAGHGSGDEIMLGSVTVGAHTFEVTHTGIAAGKEAHIDLTFAAGKPRPGTVRGWVGIESATGSMKGKFTNEGENGMHGHITPPSPMPAGSKLWLEVEENGKTTTGSIALK